MALVLVAEPEGQFRAALRRQVPLRGGATHVATTSLRTDSLPVENIIHRNSILLY